MCDHGLICSCSLQCELKSKLLVSSLITPIILPYITPFKTVAHVGLGFKVLTLRFLE